MSEPKKVTYLVNQDGNVVKVDAGDAQELVNAGYLPASDKQTRDARLQENYGGIGSQLAAGAEHAADALTGGQSTAAETMLGVNPVAIEGREEANPTASTVGTVAGSIGGIASGGEEAVGLRGAVKGAQAVSAPAVTAGLGALAKGAAESGAESLLRGGAEGELSTAKRLAVKAAGGVAQGTTEGAIYGAGHVVHEEALGDPNLTAQNAISEIGLSALLGGSASGLLGAGEVALPAAIQKAKDAVAAGFGQAEKGLASAYQVTTDVPKDMVSFMLDHKMDLAGLEKQAPEAVAQMPHATPEMADWMLKNGQRLGELEQAFPGTTGKMARMNPQSADYLLDNWGKIITDPEARIQVATNIRTSLQEQLDSAQGVLKRVNTKFAGTEEESLLQGADHAKAKEAYESLAAKVDQAAQDMRAEPELNSPAHARKLEMIRDGLVRDADLAGSSDSALETFRRLKTLRQQLDENISFGADAMGMGVSERNSNDVLKALRRDVNATLKDEDVFGAQAVRKTALDDVQSSFLKLTNGKGAAFKKAFLGADGKVASTKVDTFLNGLAKDKGVESSAALGDFLSSVKRVVDEAEQSAKHVPTTDFDAASLRTLHEKTAKMIQEAQLSGKVTAQMKYLQSGGVGIPNSGAVSPGAVVGAQAVVGHIPVIGGIAAKVVGKIAEPLSSVPKGVAMLARLQSLGTRAGKFADAAAKGLVTGSRFALHPLSSTGAQLTALSTWKQRAETLQKAAGGPQDMVDTLTKSTAQIQEHAPNTSQGIQVSTSRAAQALMSLVPKEVRNGPMGPLLRPPDVDVRKFNQAWDVLNNPASILEHAQAGTLTPQLVSLVAQAYPEYHSQLVQSIMGAAAEHRGTTPYRNKLMLGMVTGSPLDNSASPQSILAAQSAHATPSRKEAQTGPDAVAPSQSGLGKLNASNAWSTPGQSLAGRMRSGE